MEKLLIQIRNTSLLTAMIFLFYTPAIAQSGNDVPPLAGVVSDDPIVSMLDSLLNQHYIEKLNISSAGNRPSDFNPSDIPSYSDDVYRSRIQKLETPIPLTYNAQVKEYIDLYAVRKRGLTERVMGLSNLYFPLFEQILDQQGLPLEFKYLSIVESALNPTAVSRVGATGLWQFMLNTGKFYNLKVNSFVDERRDPYKSTLAACQYFKDMYKIYNDWLLVIAAYNCGAGNVNKAIARSGGKTTFWEISSYLPRETRGYVPAFMAVTYLMNHSSEHNLNAVSPVASYFEFDTVMVNHKITLREIADAINSPVELLSFLNPMYRKGVIPHGNEPFVLKLPTGKINTYIAKQETIFKPSIELENAATLANGSLNDPSYISKVAKKYYKVKNGDRLATIADQFNCSANDIKKWNKLKSTKLKSGQKLVLFVSTMQKEDQTAAINKNEIKTSVGSDGSTKNSKGNKDLIQAKNNSKRNSTNSVNAPEKSTEKFVYHIVQKGDTLWSIAKRYQGVTVEDLKTANRLSTNALKPGTRLKVVIGG